MKSWIIVILGTILLLVLLPLLAAIIFQSNIKDEILSRLNEATNNQLTYQDAEVIYLKSFPKLNLQLTKPQFLDTDYNEVVQLEELRVSVKLIPLLQKKVMVDEFTLKEGRVYLSRQNGTTNIASLLAKEDKEPSEPTQQKTSGTVHIDKLSLDNIELVLDDIDNNIQLKNTIEKGRLKIALSDSIDARGTVQLQLDSVSMQDSFYRMDVDKKLDFHLSKYEDQPELNIIKFDIGDDVHISGVSSDLKLHFDQYAVDEWSTLLRSVLKNEDSELDGNVNGVLELGEQSSVDLKSDNLEVIIGKGQSRFEVENIEFAIFGLLNHVLDWNLKANLNSEPMEMEGVLDLEKKMLKDVRGLGMFNLESLNPFLPDSITYQLEGKIELEHFNLADVSFQDSIDTDQVLKLLTLRCKPKEIRIINKEKAFLQFDKGKILIYEGQFLMEEIEITQEDSEALMQASFVTREGKKPLLRANIDSKFIELEQLQYFFTGVDSEEEPAKEEESKIEKRHIIVPFDYKINLYSKEAKHRKIDIERFDAIITSEEEVIEFSSEFQAFEGDNKIAGDLSIAEDGYTLNINANLKNVELNTLLEESNNFGQDFITEKNLKGRVTSLGLLEIDLDSRFQPLGDKTKGKFMVKIRDGELKDLPMLEQFSQFIHAEDLKRVKFSDLSNYLEIQGKNLYIPTMFIQSNAANFTLTGTHTADQKILYFIKVNAGQILADRIKGRSDGFKPRKAKRSGWFNIYIKTYGTADNVETDRDRDAVQAAFRRGEIRKEIIHRELVDFFGPMPELTPPHDWDDK